MAEPVDIFVSYAREDEDRAGKLVRALEACGWRVFWDRTIPPGETWRSHIGVPLDQATVVLVAWSHHSIDADFVHSEAGRAKSRGALVPVLFDDVAPPLGFEHIHAADLTRWIAGPPVSLPDLLVRTLERRLAQPARVTAPPAPQTPVTMPAPVPAAAPQAAAAPGRRVPLSAVAGVVVALIAATGLGVLLGGRSDSMSSEVTALREQNRRLEDTTKTATARIAAMEKELADLRHARDDAEERLNAVAVRAAAADKALDTARSEARAAAARADAAEAALRTAQEKLRVATERLAALEGAKSTPEPKSPASSTASSPVPPHIVCVISVGNTKQECEWKYPDSIFCGCNGRSGTVVEK